jgi:hypothetical protein
LQRCPLAVQLPWPPCTKCLQCCPYRLLPGLGGPRQSPSDLLTDSTGVRQNTEGEKMISMRPNPVIRACHIERIRRLKQSNLARVPMILGASELRRGLAEERCGSQST